MTGDIDFDRRVRVAIAETLRTRGATPTLDAVATALACDRRGMEAAFTRMIAGRVFIPRPGSLEILAYNPFCAERTEFAVTAADRSWWAICAWDSLGIPPALGVQGVVDARCADCAGPIRIEVGLDGAVSAPDGTVMQVGISARDFWKDILRT